MSGGFDRSRAEREGMEILESINRKLEIFCWAASTMSPEVCFILLVFFFNVFALSVVDLLVVQQWMLLVYIFWVYRNRDVGQKLLICGSLIVPWWSAINVAWSCHCCLPKMCDVWSDNRCCGALKSWRRRTRIGWLRIGLKRTAKLRQLWSLASWWILLWVWR